MKSIILASKSLDRGELLRRSNIPFEILITNVNEEAFKENISIPIRLARALAQAKAETAKLKLKERNRDAIIVAADTIVDLDGEIIGKAKNSEEAFQIIKKLSGKTHNLITAIAITDTTIEKIIVEDDCTTVKFMELTDQEISGYIKTDEWKGRAGAYSLRDKASLFIEAVNGSPSSVIGLSMQRIFQILKTEFSLNLLTET